MDSDWEMPKAVRIGMRLDGYCGGVFGRDSFHCRRVEAIGSDWIVTRNEDDGPEFLSCRNIDFAIERHDPKFREEGR